MKIGSDPEFVLVDTASGIPVDTYEAGIPESTRSRVGTDGGGFLGELRPKAETSPIQHWLNIRDLFCRVSDYVPDPKDLTVRAGSTGAIGADHWHPIGGHIHLGLFRNETIVGQTLDYYLAIPVLFIEEFPYNKLRRQSYGRLTETRENNHGIEYRTLSSWLVDPVIARSILCTSYLVGISLYDEVLNPVKGFTELDKTSFEWGILKAFENFIPVCENILSKLPEYREFKDEVDFLFRMIKLNYHWNEKLDIVDRWINCEKEWKEYLKNRNKYIQNHFKLRTRRVQGILPRISI